VSDQVAELTAIREHAWGVGLPGDDPKGNGYLFRLGLALYGFAWATGFMCEVITYLDPAANQTKIADRAPEDILRKFKSSAAQRTDVDIAGEAAKILAEYKRLNEERNDFVHAFPVTGQGGNQVLQRRKDKHGKYFEVTNDFLDDFNCRLRLVTEALYAIREITR